MPKTKAITTKQLEDVEKNLTGITEADMLSPEVMQKLEDKMPEFLKEYARDGTAIVRWNYEHLIIIEYLLREYFNFNEGELEKLEKKLKEILPKIVGMKMETPILITKADYAEVADKMVYANKQIGRRDEAGRKGILLPKSPLKKLK
jgi:hypothetical protein